VGRRNGLRSESGMLGRALLQKMKTEICQCGSPKTKGSIRCMGCYTRRCPVNESAFHAVWNDYVQASRRRKLGWGLTKDQARNLFQQPCAYCGQPPRAVKTIPLGRGSFTFNGIDRRDNLQGYVLTNCVACCRVCNIMKQNMSVEEFLAQVGRIWEVAHGIR